LAAEVSGQEGNNFTPVQETTGPDWNDICNKISFALISHCSDLVNPDNTLTQQGEHVKGCVCAIQKPHIPIYLGGYSQSTFVRMANYANGWICIIRNSLDEAKSNINKGP
jgi:hypothetical protein